MIFKRKEARPLQPGDYCVINSSAREIMRTEKSYSSKSIVEQAVEGNRYITRRNLRKSNNKSQIFATDMNLGVVKKTLTAFGGDVIEVVPLSIEQDGCSAWGLRSFFKNKKTFLFDKKILNRSSNTIMDFNHSLGTINIIRDYVSSSHGLLLNV